jgi:peptide/nickel transport system substrate-binding protein
MPQGERSAIMIGNARMKRRTFIAGALATGAALACGPNAAASPSPRRGGTLVAAGEAVGDNFVPAVGLQGWGHVWILNGIYESLYTSDFKTFIPVLATGHTVSADGRRYTFALRKDVKFHDGTPFNAAAVEFNYMRYLDKTHPFYDENAIYRTNILPNVTSVKATDEFTVDIMLSQPSGVLIAALCGAEAGFMSPTAVKSAGVLNAGRTPVGTGPFIFEKAEKGNQASMTANDKHWRARPSLDRVVVREIPDDQAVTASLLSGEVDITPFVDFKNLETFRNNSKLNVQETPAASTGYSAVNQAHPVMKDVRVRQAYAHAINRQRIIDTIFYGHADPVAGQIPLAMWAYAPEFKDFYKYDPQQAKDLLKAAGTPSPEFALFCPNSGFWPRMAELVQSDLNAVGFKASIQQVDTAAFGGQMTEGKHAAYIWDATLVTPEPEGLFLPHFGCSNPRSKRYGYCDPTFDEMLVRQESVQSQDERKKIMSDMQKMLLDEVTMVPLYYNRFVTVSNKRVVGYVPLPTRWMFLDKVSLTS